MLSDLDCRFSYRLPVFYDFQEDCIGMMWSHWSASYVCIHIKEISAGTAGNQLTMSPVFEMFWQTSFFGGEEIDKPRFGTTFDQNENKDVTNSNCVRTLQCACHAGQLIPS